LQKCLLDKKKRKGRKKITAFIFALFAFDRLTDRPTDDPTDHWPPLRPERMFRAQCFRVTCFTSENLLDKNPEGKKNSDAIKKKKFIKIVVVSHHILTHPSSTHTHMYTHKKTSSLIIINVINQSINKPPNSRFSSLVVPILGLNAYLSPEQDKPGLTRLT
jgi:hypothetical protein